MLLLLLLLLLLMLLLLLLLRGLRSLMDERRTGKR
jgi:hypothetical protein